MGSNKIERYTIQILNAIEEIKKHNYSLFYYTIRCHSYQKATLEKAIEYILSNDYIGNGNKFNFNLFIFEDISKSNFAYIASNDNKIKISLELE